MRSKISVTSLLTTLRHEVSFNMASIDSATLKMLMDSQERAFRSALDVVVQQMGDQIRKLEDKVRDLTTSLEYTQQEVDQLKTNAKEHDKERKEDKTKIEKLMQQDESSNLKIKDLEDKIIYQEDYMRRKNLRISGLEEHRDETWEQTSAAVTSLLESKLQLPGVVLERAHRVGPRRDNKPRTVVARFTRYSDREAAIRRGSHLKGTNIFLNEDMSPTSLAVKNAQMPMFRQARAEGKIAFFRHTKLIIRERKSEEAATREQVSTGASVGAGGDLGTLADHPGTASGIVQVEAAGAWTGRDNTRSPSLSSQRSDGSRLPGATPASPAVSSQKKEGKRDLRRPSRK